MRWRSVQKGFIYPEKHLIELDRRRAIGHAIDAATRDDIILIAGKGHETKQYFSHYVIDFDDRLIAKEYCQSLRDRKEITLTILEQENGPYLEDFSAGDIQTYL